MKKLFLFIAVVAFACGQNRPINNGSLQIRNFDTLSGVYEYVYPDNTPDLIENHFIRLTISDGVISGYYYGTSDEFDEAREGYLPAFFVSKMDNLEILGDTIKFILNVDNDDFLTQTVDLKYQSTEEALSSGYKKWENKISTSPRQYMGVIQNRQTIILHEEKLNKTFKKINK